MEKIQEELKSLPEGDKSKRLLYEKMADNAVEILNFKIAITYYGKTVIGQELCHLMKQILSQHLDLYYL